MLNVSQEKDQMKFFEMLNIWRQIFKQFKKNQINYEISARVHNNQV
jgi:hypothetical protein